MKLQTKPYLKSPGHTALYSLITTKARQNIISREADNIKSNEIILFKVGIRNKSLKKISLINSIVSLTFTI